MEDISLAGIGIALGIGGTSASAASASFDCIPTELVIGILSKLPVKTILLTTCVCKRWYSIIKTPSFVYYDDHNFYLYSDDNIPSLQAKLKIPFETFSKSIRIVGSCNGLLCITDFDYSCRGVDVYLINPCIHKYKKLQGSCYPDLLSMGEIRINVVIGFGYSDVDNDYKVVRHLWDNCVGRPGSVGWSKVEVFSLKSGQWKVIIEDSVSYLDNIVPPLVDCCLYWERDNYLQCFDLNCEVFRKIEIPANYSN